MQITSALSVDLSTTGLATTPRNSAPAAASSSTATQQTTPADSDSFTSSVAPQAASATASPQAKVAPASSAPAQTAASANSSAQTPPASSSAPAKGSLALASQISASISEAATLAASYSTTVGGKNYSGTVEESGGTYTASVANLLGAIASGSSIQSAENNLSIRIDTLV